MFDCHKVFRIFSIYSLVISERVRSVDTGGKEEMLDDGHNLDLAKVKEELVKLFLVRAIQNQVCPEDENASGKDRQDFQGFEADNPVQQHVDLVHFKTANEAKVNPLEGYT